MVAPAVMSAPLPTGPLAALMQPATTARLVQHQLPAAVIPAAVSAKLVMVQQQMDRVKFAPLVSSAKVVQELCVSCAQATLPMTP